MPKLIPANLVTISSVYYGGTSVSSLYYGSDILWPSVTNITWANSDNSVYSEYVTFNTYNNLFYRITIPNTVNNPYVRYYQTSSDGTTWGTAYALGNNNTITARFIGLVPDNTLGTAVALYQHSNISPAIFMTDSGTVTSFNSSNGYLWGPPSYRTHLRQSVHNGSKFYPYTYLRLPNGASTGTSSYQFIYTISNHTLVGSDYVYAHAGNQGTKLIVNDTWVSDISSDTNIRNLYLEYIPYRNRLVLVMVRSTSDTSVYYCDYGTYTWTEVTSTDDPTMLYLGRIIPVDDNNGLISIHGSYGIYASTDGYNWVQSNSTGCRDAVYSPTLHKILAVTVDGDMLIGSL